MTKFDFIEEDKRIIDQKLRRHALPAQEYQKLLKNLPDDKEHFVEVPVYEQSDDVDTTDDTSNE